MVGPFNDLDRLGRSICDIPGTNGLLAPATDIQLVYDFLHKLTSMARPSTYDPILSHPGFLVADSSSAVAVADKQHIDAYLYAAPMLVAGIGAFGGDSISIDGSISHPIYSASPADFMSANEDSLTGLATPIHTNSLQLVGAHPAYVGDTSATSAWTRPNARANEEFDHEFEHTINLDGYTTSLHMLASAAEAVGGMSNDSPTDDAPYTRSLMQDGGRGSQAQNYQAWSSFTAYIAYNFRGIDRSATNAGFSDDLLWRWGHQPDSLRSLYGLGRVLEDANCPECASAYPYFAGLSGRDRMELLVHNWRVACYVNNYALAQHQYGYDPQFGYDPSAKSGYWRAIDPYADHSLSVPPGITITSALESSELSFRERPPYPGQSTPRALSIPVYGAEYFVLHAGTGMASGTRDLAIRVTADSINRNVYVTRTGSCGPRPDIFKDGELWASVVTYSTDDTALLRFPQYATGVTTKRLVADRPRGDLTFLIPRFGADTRAALVVITHGDGPTGYFSPQQGIGSPDAIPVRLTLGLRKNGMTEVAPALAIPFGPSALSHPAWSPDGVSLAYAVKPAIGPSQIVMVPATGGNAYEVAPGPSSQYAPDWSPDGQWIAYAQDSASSQRDIWMTSLLGEGTERLTFQHGSACEFPAYHPDGASLVYTRRITGAGLPGPARDLECVGCSWEIRRVDLASRTDAVLYTLQGSGSINSMRWASDGRWLFISYTVPPTPGNPGGTYFYQLAADGSRLVLRRETGWLPPSLTPPPGNGPWLGERRGSWPYRSCDFWANVGCHACSADTARISFRQLATVDTLTDIAVPLLFVSGNEYREPAWSPDGTRAAYVVSSGGTSAIEIGQVIYDHPPRFGAIESEYFIPAGTAYYLSMQATDSDGDAITYVVDQIPPGASFLGSTFAWPAPPLGTYRLVVRALDAAGGVDKRIVLFHVTTRGGGGGGFMAGLAAPGGMVPEENIVQASGFEVPASELFHFRVQPQPVAGSYRVRLRQLGSDAATLDQVRLIRALHSDSSEAFATSGRIVAGRRLRAASVRHRGIELADSLDGRSLFTLAAGETLAVSLMPPGSGAAPFGLAIEGLRAGAGTAATDLAVLVPDPISGWSPWREDLLPCGRDVIVVDDLPAAQVLLLARNDVSLASVARYVPSAPAETTGWAAVSALDIAARQFAAELADVDGLVATLAAGDTLQLVFPIAPAAGPRATWFLGVEGANLGNLATRARRAPRDEGDVISALALLPPQPNPFGRSTTLRLELPRAANVRLAVFDLQGRRVRTLFAGSKAAGHLAFEWNGLDDAGRRVRPGVYLCRAMVNHETLLRRMTLLP
jgi:Tol biopolymer transport system component